jgi:3-methyladenine DNA glycosylase AlkD
VRAAAGARALAARIGRELSADPEATVAQLRAVRRRFSRELRETDPRVVIEATLLMSRVPKHGCRFVSFELIQHHPRAPSLLGARVLERFGRGMASWDAVDCFAVFLSGPAWRSGRVPTRLIHTWARSADRWWRRAALVSTVPLNCRAQGGTGDSRRTLGVCRLLERDRDPMVVKAMSWALRQLSLREPQAVRRYLASRGGALAALVRREVRNKMETGLKNPGKRRAAR